MTQYKAVYVKNDIAAVIVDAALKELSERYPEIDFDEDWEDVPPEDEEDEDDDRCEWCKDNGNDQCPHMGM